MRHCSRWRTLLKQSPQSGCLNPEWTWIMLRAWRRPLNNSASGCQKGQQTIDARHDSINRLAMRRSILEAQWMMPPFYRIFTKFRADDDVSRCHDDLPLHTLVPWDNNNVNVVLSRGAETGPAVRYGQCVMRQVSLQRISRY